MRRADKQVSDLNWMESILMKGQICRVGLSGNDYPYIVPVNYGYHGGKLYFHSACEGKKLEMIRSNPNVCVQVDIETMIEKSEVPCNFSTRYKSVIGYGKAKMVEDPTEKKTAMGIIVKHYKHDHSMDYEYQNMEDVCLVQVEMEEMTGKHSA